MSSGNITTPAGGSQPQFPSRDLITNNPGEFVSTNGLLATVTINTNGATPGNYSLLMTGTIDPGSDSQFVNGVGNPVPGTFGAGTITVTPEPEAIGLIALAAFPLLRRRASSRAGN